MSVLFVVLDDGAERDVVGDRANAGWDPTSHLMSGSLLAITVGLVCRAWNAALCHCYYAYYCCPGLMVALYWCGSCGGSHLYSSNLSLVAVDQCIQPQVNARLHDLVTTLPSLFWSLFWSTSQHSSHCLVRDSRVLLCPSWLIWPKSTGMRSACV